MGQLSYHKRTYFRSSQTDAESFRPYLIAIISIVFVTIVGVSIQNIIVSGNAFGQSTSEPLSMICKPMDKQETCPNTKISLITYLEGTLSSHTLQSSTN